MKAQSSEKLSQEQLNGALLEAVQNGAMNKIDDLVRQGAAVNAKDIYGATPLHMAAFFGKTETVSQLLELGAEIEAETTRYKNTPLHYAASEGHLETVAKLLEFGADIKAKDNEGETPLHRAASKGHPETVAKLLEFGADIKAKDNKGWTPLHNAAMYGTLETIAILLNLGAEADIETQDNEGKTPLHIANSWGKIEIVELMKQWGKDKKAKPGFFSSVMAKAKQLQAAISEVPAEKVTGAVVEKQNKSEVKPLPQRLQTESDPQKVAASALEPSAPLQNNKNTTKEASPLTKASSLKHPAESKEPTTPPLSPSMLPKVAEETYPLSSSFQVSEKALSQADMTSLKMSALLSLKEQQTKLAADIQKLQALTQVIHSPHEGKLVSLTPEQEEALNKLTYKQTQLKALEQLKATPNLGEFYQTFVINIEALCLAIKTAQTNLMKVQLQGTSGKVAQVTQIVGSFLEAIPVIGNTAKSVSNVATKVLTKFDERLIAQKLKQLHELGTQKQWQTFILGLAKFLTLRYEDQLVRLLPTPTETAPDSPARALANYVVMSLFDHLMSYPVTITSFFSSSRPVTLTFEKVRAEFLDKLAPRSQTTLTELGLMLLTFLSKDTVLSRFGEKLSLQAILTKPGIRVGNTAFFDHDAGKLTDAAQYGYRLGTEQEALQYKLIKSTNKAPTLSATKPNASVSSSTPTPSTPGQKAQAVRVSVEVTATSLPKPTPANSNQEIPQTTDLQQVLQRLAALEKANQEKDKELALLKQKQNQPSSPFWVGRVQDVPVGTQILMKKELLQSDLYDSASPQVQAQRIAVLEERVSYTEQLVSNLTESVESTTKIALGIRTASVIPQTIASASQKGTSPSK